MSFGMAVWDGAGVQTLGMEDFTLQRIAIMTLPARSSAGQGVKSDYIVMDVDGYDPANCLVLITPKVYATYPQPGYPDSWGMSPTYVDLGGTRIGIVTYVNYRVPTGYKNNYRDMWKEQTVESVIEVVRVI